MVIKKYVTFVMVLVVIMISGFTAYAAEKENSVGKLININTANTEELVKLPRVGEKIAQRIIEFREKNGKFKKTAELMKVKGIGEKTFEKLKDMITV